MKKVTGTTITMDQIRMVNREMDYPEDELTLSRQGYAFYYNQMYINDLDLCDIDRYANLNTILGYDVGIRKFRSLDCWLWENGYDLMELSGSNEDKKLLQQATEKTRTKPLDYSKWKNLKGEKYSYSFFEKGSEYK